MKKYVHKHFPIRIQAWIRVNVYLRLMAKWIILLLMVKCSVSVDIKVEVEADVLGRYQKKSGQGQQSQLALGQLTLVPASVRAAKCAQPVHHATNLP